MRRLLTNPALLVTIAAAVLWGGLVLWAPVDPLNYVLKIGISLLALATLARWGRAAVRVYLQGARDAEDAVILAQCLTAISYLWYAGFTAFSRYLGSPDWLISSPWSAFFAYIAIMGFALAIFSTRLRDESPSVTVAFIVTMGTALGLGLTTFGHMALLKAGAMLALLIRMFH